MLGDGDSAERASLTTAAQQLRALGTHLDHWVKDHFDDAAEWLGAELVIRSRIAQEIEPDVGVGAEPPAPEPLGYER